ncbi:MAG: MATE family efflux transporter, partial [Deltaproteobacteria bacterium]|nr:MATE family efflux transporter [Deltaproteobacteria bacterium]
MSDLGRPGDPASQKGSPLRVVALLRAAIAGTEQDYTKVGLHQGIVLLAIPMVLEMAMESVFSLADV